jgi:hypothetical protein
MRTSVMALALTTTAMLLGAPLDVAADQGRGQGRGRGAQERPADHYFARHGYLKLDIPPGHYPPPGECRVWFPGRPPGQQPPPARCDALDVPPGAWVFRHPAVDAERRGRGRGSDRDHVLVDVYDDQRRGHVVVTGEFEIVSGVFVRIVVNR